jgi:hypothetical protein
MSVKDIFAAAFNKDASSFETAFSSVMKEKVIAAVENKFFAVEEYELEESKYEDDEEEDDEDDEELEEKKLTAKDVKNALASAKAKPKETVSLKKPPFKMDEEAEELDELSKKTLGSYTKAAANDIGHLQRDITNREPGYKSLQAKRNNRRDGIERAVDRLTKEEAEQIDELSSDTLASYNSKANVSRAKAMGSMRNTAGGMDFAYHKKKLDKRDAGIKTATSKYNKKLDTKEEVDLDEASDKE